MNRFIHRRRFITRRLRAAVQRIEAANVCQVYQLASANAPHELRVLTFKNSKTSFDLLRHLTSL